LPGIRIMHVVRPVAGGIKNHLLALIGQSHGVRFHHQVACPPGSLEQALKSLGVETFPVSLGGEVSPLRDLAALRDLISILKRERVQLLHAHSSKAGLVGRLAAGLAGVPAVVLTVHNSVFQDRWPAWKKAGMALCERGLAGRTGRIITVSNALARELTIRERISPEKIVTIYNGIEPGNFSLAANRDYLWRITGIPPGKRVVGTVARLAPQKGVADFIRAAAILGGSMPEVNFLVVGDGPLKAELEQQAKQAGLSGRVFFTGERRDVDSIMPCLDVFVLASATEGLPLTLLEALAAGRPVVASRVGGIPEVVSHGVNGLLVDPGDVAGLARSMRSVLECREMSRAMGETGRRMVMESFTVGQMAGSTERVYLELVAGGPGR